jgi:hypothetical protein
MGAVSGFFQVPGTAVRSDDQVRRFQQSSKSFFRLSGSAFFF